MAESFELAIAHPSVAQPKMVELRDDQENHTDQRRRQWVLPFWKWNMCTLPSVEIVEQFWSAVWKGRDPNAIDRFVVDDFVLTAGGVDVVSKGAFKEWVRKFLATITDFEFEVLETFQNEDGSRVASRWRVSGKNNGLLGTNADQRPITFTGTAVWAVREDGKLLHNWVERSLWELSQSLHKQE